MRKIRKDLTNETFGRWTVLQRMPDKACKSGKVFDMWLCECSCKNHTQKIVYGDNLRSGKSTSCGCQAKETIKRNCLATHNQYEDCGDYYIGYTKKGEPFYFDKEDYELIKCHVWYIGEDGYVVTHNPDTSGHRLIRMHRLVMNLTDDEIKIDHKDRKRNNNRKSNLRVATPQQNMMNASKQVNSVYSRYKGVCYHKNGKMWVSYIRVNGKRVHLGSFKTELEAAKAYEEAAKKYFGEFACVEPGTEGAWNDNVC